MTGLFHWLTLLLWYISPSMQTVNAWCLQQILTPSVKRGVGVGWSTCFSTSQLLLRQKNIARRTTPRQLPLRRRISIPVFMWNTRNHPCSYYYLQFRGGDDLTCSPVARCTQRPMISAAAASSVLAGSLAGAVGVGVAFPLDTLKTKAQVMVETSDTKQRKTMIQVVQEIYRTEGLQGFFGGVRGMMLGQSIIKSIAFGSNALMLATLQQHFPNTSHPAILIITAACVAGFVTSFVVTPVERVKVLMQASTGGTYANEVECIRAILKREGWTGFISRGLVPTLLREVPSCGIYFFVYGMLMQTHAATILGAVAPLLFGAASGCASWIPVYPVDVVKTIVQNTEGEEISCMQVIQDLYSDGGVSAFFDGLTPKMLRAAVNHAITFWVYDWVQGAMVS